MTDTKKKGLAFLNTAADGGAENIKDALENRLDTIGGRIQDFITRFMNRDDDKVPAEDVVPIRLAEALSEVLAQPTPRLAQITKMLLESMGRTSTSDTPIGIGSGDDSTGGDTPAPTPKTVRNKQAYDLLDKLLESDDTREGTIALLRRLGESGHKDSVKLAKSLTDLGWLESEVKMRDMFTKDQLDKAVKEEVAKRLSNDDTIKAAKAEVVDELKPQIATIYATLNQDGTSKGVKFFSKEGFFYPMAAMTKMSKAIEALRKRVGIPDLPDDDA